jgi:serine/threonine protein kinase
MSNILLEESGIVMVSDFGLYRIMVYKPRFGSGSTEQQETQQSLNEEMQLDISSLGIIFYHLVTGKPPYESTSTLLFSRGSNKPNLVPPSTYTPEVPEKLEEVIVKSLAHDSDNQYHTIDELVKDLANLKRKVRTAMLPSAQLAELAQYSNRFTKFDVPETLTSKKIEKTTLYFPDNGQMLELKEGKEYSIGRQYKGQPILPDIDLTPFKGYDWGISRLHASLRAISSKVYITDLGSSNGTWIDGERITSNKPHELDNGDIFLLGRLRVQVLMPD